MWPFVFEQAVKFILVNIIFHKLNILVYGWRCNINIFFGMFYIF